MNEEKCNGSMQARELQQQLSRIMRTVHGWTSACSSMLWIHREWVGSENWKMSDETVDHNWSWKRRRWVIIWELTRTNVFPFLIDASNLHHVLRFGDAVMNSSCATVFEVNLDTFEWIVKMSIPSDENLNHLIDQEGGTSFKNCDELRRTNFWGVGFGVNVSSVQSPSLRYSGE